MTKPGARPIGRDIWICESNFLVCNRGDHLFTLYKTGYRGDLRRLSGHAFFACTECAPATFMFAVFSKHPDPHITCYAISKEDFEHWDKARDVEELSTPEMLYRLKDPQGNSYNPYWRPPR